MVIFRTTVHRSMVVTLNEHTQQAHNKRGISFRHFTQEIAPDLFMAMFVYNSESDRETGMAFIKRFVSNEEPGCPNPFGIDLTRSGMFELVSETMLPPRQVVQQSPLTVPSAATSAAAIPAPVLLPMTEQTQAYPLVEEEEPGTDKMALQPPAIADLVSQRLFTFPAYEPQDISQQHQQRQQQQNRQQQPATMIQSNQELSNICS